MKKIPILVGILVLAVAAIAFASYTTGIYKEQGGAKMVVASGGEVEVQSGGALDLQTGAAINIPTATNATMPDADTAGLLAVCTNCFSGHTSLLYCNGSHWLAANGTLPDSLAQ